MVMRIFYSSPFSLEKNIGKALNEFCEIVPEDSWIVCTDGDTLFLRSDWGNQIKDIIERYGDKYKLIGCTTNRLRGTHQLFKNTFSNDGDISNHVEIANHLHKNFYSEVEPASYIAGLCMIFHKSTWEKVKFNENSLQFDKEFNTAIRKEFGGHPIGIAKGLYLFHLYRWGTKDPFNSISHLTKTK